MSQDPFAKHGWFQCTRCRCTYPVEGLRSIERSDLVLNIKSTVYECTNYARCARFKIERDAVLEQERLQNEQAAAAAAVVDRRIAVGELRIAAKSSQYKPRRKS